MVFPATIVAFAPIEAPFLMIVYANGFMVFCSIFHDF